MSLLPNPSPSSLLRQKGVSPEGLEILIDPWRWDLAYPYPGRDGEEGHSEMRFLAWLRSNRHQDSFPEMMIALSGKGYFGTDNDASGTLAHPGSVFIFPPKASHQVGYPPFYPVAEHLWFNVLRDHCTAHLVRVQNKTYRCVFSTFFPIPPSLLADLTERDANQDFHRLRMMTAASAVVYHFIIQGVSFEQRGGGARDEFHREMVSIARRHIADTAGKGVSLDSLARLTGYSKFHLLRLFKRFTGSTVLECVNDARLRKCREMADAGNPRKEIAEELGFSCPAAFSHWLRKTGIPPAARKRWKPSPLKA